MEVKKGFNLLRPQLNPDNKWDKIYTWINGTARFIVIFVEIIVIMSFVARVVVDRQARDLEKRLEQNKAQLDNLSEKEKEIREVQLKVNQYGEKWNGASLFNNVLEEVYSYSPERFSKFTLTLEENELNLTGITEIQIIGELEQTMKNSDFFTSVELSSFKPEGRENQRPGDFSIRATIKDEFRDQLPLIVFRTDQPILEPLPEEVELDAVPDVDSFS